MYSEQLDNLIQSIIADGQITEKERAVLHKRAEAEGVDVDEVDVYVDGLLNKDNQNDKRTVERFDIKLFSRIPDGDDIIYL